MIGGAQAGRNSGGQGEVFNVAKQLAGKALGGGGFGAIGSPGPVTPKPITAPALPKPAVAPTVPIGQVLQPNFQPLYPVGQPFNFMSYFQNLFRQPANTLSAGLKRKEGGDA